MPADDTIEVNSEQLKWAGQHLLKADKAIQAAVRKRIRELGQPLGLKVLAAYGAAMPQAGGLAARIAQRGKVSILTNLAKGSVYLSLSEKGGMRLAPIEAGQVRHPTYGHQPWKLQPVPAGVGKGVVEAEAPAMAEEIAKVATDAFWEAIR